LATYDYDLAIVGGGSAGLTAAKVGRFFAEKRIAMIDKQRLGGDCLYYGCVPSKALIKSARVAHEIANAERYGLTRMSAATSLGSVNDRVQHAIGVVGAIDSTEHLRESGVDVFLGGGRFIDAHTIAAGEKTLTAKYALICTGAASSPRPSPASVQPSPSSRKVITSSRATTSTSSPSWKRLSGRTASKSGTTQESMKSAWKAPGGWW
jgi:pyruvate/2-oxoglutarate dehydrogenase complex dihydrolipoamide dehydrogenase (E3) component